MSQQINLKDLERKAWRSFFQDGIWDIFLGLIMMAFAVSAFMSALDIRNSLRMGTYIGIEILAMTFMMLGKKFITVPRMGQAKFKHRRKKRLWVIFVLGVSVFVGLVAWFLMGRRGEGIITADTMPILWAINCLVVFGFMAYFLDYDRLYFIGFLFALMVPVDRYILYPNIEADLSYLAFGVPGLIVLTMGIVIFVRFLRDYPVVRIDETGSPSERGG